MRKRLSYIFPSEGPSDESRDVGQLANCEWRRERWGKIKLGIPYRYRISRGLGMAFQFHSRKQANTQKDRHRHRHRHTNCQFHTLTRVTPAFSRLPSYIRIPHTPPPDNQTKHAASTTQTSVSTSGVRPLRLPTFMTLRAAKRASSFANWMLRMGFLSKSASPKSLMKKGKKK